MIIDILSLVITFIVLIILAIVYYNKGNVWIQDDVNNIYIQQKVNRKKLKMEIKKLEHQDIYNSFIIYDDLQIRFPVNIDMQDVIDQNRRTDRPIEIRWNEYTKSFHIRYKDHYRKKI